MFFPGFFTPCETPKLEKLGTLGLIARDLFAVPIFCVDIVLVVLESPDAGTDSDCNLN